MSTVAEDGLLQKEMSTSLKGLIRWKPQKSEWALGTLAYAGHGRVDRRLSLPVPLGRTCRGLMARPRWGSSRSSSGSKGPVVGPPPLSLDDSWRPCVLAHELPRKHVNW